MKKCRGCGEIKVLGEYYAHPQMADGYLNFCKECVKDRISRAWYSNAEYNREKDRERGKRRMLDPEEVEKHRKRVAIFRTREIQRAHNQTQRKLAKERPSQCPICGAEKLIVAHHEDYAKPLDVTWCCTPCHRQIHLRKRTG